jgi:hypothetical protein
MSDYNLQPDDELHYQPEEQEEADRASRLAASPEEETLPLRMRLVDQLFSSAPMAIPGADFADRVLAAIKDRSPYILKPHAGLGVALGLGFSIAFVGLLLAGVIAALVMLVLNWREIYGALASVLGDLVTTVGQTVDEIGRLLNTLPNGSLIVLIGLPIALVVWLMVMRRMRQTAD